MQNPKVSNVPTHVPNTKSSAVYGNLSRQRNAVEIDATRSQLYHPSVADLASQCSSSTNILEVFHGQTNCHQLSHLPNPESSECLPKRQANSTAHTQHSLKTEKNRDLRLHFRDILSVGDTQSFSKRTRPNVTWASHKFPPNLVSPRKQENSTSSSSSSSVAQSPRQGKLVSKSLSQFPSRQFTQNKVKTTSYARSNKHASHTGEITTALVHTRLANPDLSSASLSKLTPSTIKIVKESKGKPPMNDTGNRQGYKRIEREHLPVAPVIKKRHSSIKQDSSLTLMPTSKPLVPSLGIASRVSLTQKPLLQ